MVHAPPLAVVALLLRAEASAETTALVARLAGPPRAVDKKSRARVLVFYFILVALRFPATGPTVHTEDKAQL